MTESIRRIHGSDFSLALAPERWSFSALTEAERCPAKFAISRGAYPSVWPGWGYPSRPSRAAVRGIVVHSAIETIISQLSLAGVGETRSGEAVAVMRRIGGISSIIDTAINGVIVSFGSNPRMRNACDSLRRSLSRDASSIRTDVQRMLGSTTLAPTNPAQPSQPDFVNEARRAVKPQGHQLGLGNFPEQRLEHRELRIAGIADLVTISEERVVITDFKTGAPQEKHIEQLMLYAVLWQGDDVRNNSPSRTLTLAVAYPHGICEVTPTPGEIDDAAANLAERISAADSSLSQSAEAKIEIESCQLCTVRHLCDDYWSVDRPQPANFEHGAGFLDIEASIRDIRSPNTFEVETHDGSVAVLHSEL
ncbi:PD-(D/E)XK nuclease family protein, partial [Gemmatimonas sp.]|uniref:PD-(D/E)XK nuclease family protein n=1 Tax=Gemmatimonas sp. TaxID=1962908 RepID=UPI0035683317